MEHISPAELNTVMRQKNDRQFVETLNRVRTATYKETDIEILKSRQIDDKDDSLFDKLHVYPKSDDVTQHNSKKLNQLETTKYSIQAIDCKKDKNSWTVGSDTGGLINILDIAFGARVMLAYNINTSDGLVNGAMGVNIIEKMNSYYHSSSV